ncbi:MAG: autotransporter-associated beta strand repeat-containing protein, partial [Kiritimatiellaeota bacterium]|nr:autotransporter-associated beta strand repeat-containing protein [Kiritimatiellota bacterium]
VNTVPFAAFTGNAAGADIDMPFGGFTSDAFALDGIPAPYRTLLAPGAYNDGAAVTMTLKNLAVGTYYQIQFWVSDSRSYGTNRYQDLSSPGGDPVRLYFQNTSGGLKNGQYALGYFVADDVTQTLTVTANQSAQINAIQVCQLPIGNLSVVKADASLVNALLSPPSQLVAEGASAAFELKVDYGYTIDAVYTNGALFASPGNDAPFAFAIEDVRENITISADITRDASVPPSYIGNSGNWSDAIKWASGLVADNGDVARFVTQGGQTIPVDAPVLLGGMYMTQNETFNASGGGSLTFADGAEIRAYHGNSTTTFNLPLLGTGGGITKRGSGGITQNALNMRFAEPFENFRMVNLMGGNLESTAAGGVAISTGNVTLAGARLTVAPSAPVGAQTIAGDGTFTVGPGPNMITLAKHGDSPGFDLTLGGALGHLPGGGLPLNRAGWDSAVTRIFLAQPPALVNGMLPPWIAAVNGPGAQISFVTHDATDGIVDAPAVDFSVAGTTDIAEVSANVPLADGTAYHALVVNNATASLAGTLTLGDGVNPTGLILNRSTVQNNVIDIGGSDLYIWHLNADGAGNNSLLASSIQGSGGVTFCSGLYPNYGQCKNMDFNPPAPCTYIGPTHILGTRVQTQSNHNPFGPGDIYVYGNESQIGGQLYLAKQFALPNNLHISGFGADQNAAIRVQGDVDIQGTIELMDDAGIQTQQNPLYLRTLIYGPGKLRLVNAPNSALSSVTLTNINTYAGGTEIATTVQLDHIRALSTGPVEILNASTSCLRFNNAEDWVYTNKVFGTGGGLAKINTGRLTIADFRGTPTGMTSLSIADGEMVLPNCAWGFTSATMGPASALTIQPGPLRVFRVAGTSDTDNSLVSLGGPVSLFVNIANTLTLDGINTYSGATAVEGGTLRIMHEDTLPPTTAFSVSSFSTLDLNGFSQTVASLNGKGWIVSTNGAPATFTFGDAQDSRFDGYITGDISLVKQGDGTATLATANTYSGDTTLLGGTLKLSAFDRTLAPTGIAPVSLWLDASNPDSLNAAHDDPVTLWKDLSANGNDFASPVTAGLTSPTVEGNKLDGKSMVRFSRTAQTRLEAWDSPANVRSFAAVLTLTDADGGSGGNQGIFGRATWSQDYGIRRKNNASELEAPGWWFFSSSDCFVNGFQTLAFIDKKPFFVVTTRNEDRNFDDMALGAFYDTGRCFSGWIGEVIGFSTTLTTPQRQQVEDYLRAKWFGSDPVPAASSDLLPVTTGVVLRNGATLDLGDTDQTVATLTGAGTITNGNLTVTDRLVINVNPDGTYDELTIAATLTPGPSAVLEIANAHLLISRRVVIPCDALNGDFAQIIPGRFGYVFANGEIRLSSRSTMILIK